MADIFVSYAADDRERVRPLIEAIESEGFSVWWDTRIGVGSSFDREIERQLDAASAVVVIWSTQSVESNWVREEASEGLQREILLPVKIDACRIPLGFRRAQTADLAKWPASQQGIDSVFTRLTELVGARVPVTPTTSDATSAQDITIAVLAFANHSSDPEVEYLCEGIAEELMNAFFNVSGLSVLSSTDTFRYKNKDVRTAEIGRELAADVVLEGGVQKGHGQLAVSARLVNVKDGHAIWSERIIRSDDDIFSIQEEIARQAVDGLRAKLGLVEGASPRVEAGTEDPMAYELFLRARQIYSNSTDLEMPNYQAVALLECAIATDPDFQRAYAALAMYYGNVASKIGALMVRNRKLQLHRQLQDRDPHSPYLWLILTREGWQYSEEPVRIEILKGEGTKRSPGNDPRAAYAWILLEVGLMLESLRYLDLVQHDHGRISGASKLHRSLALTSLGRFDEVESVAFELRKSSEFATLRAMVGSTSVLAAVLSEDFDRAEDGLDALPTVDRPFYELLVRQSRGDPIEINSDLLTADPERGPLFLGFLELLTGKTDTGFDTLITHVQNEMQWNTYMQAMFLAMRLLLPASVRESPRYQELLNVMGLDDVSREELRRRAATLTPITGVEVGPLIKL